MAKEDEQVRAALQTLLRTVRDAEDLIAGAIDGGGEFELSAAQTRAMASMLVRLHTAMADGHRALREAHVALAREADQNAEWGLSSGGPS